MLYGHHPIRSRGVSPSRRLFPPSESGSAAVGIAYPTDLQLLPEARGTTDRVIDYLVELVGETHGHSGLIACCFVIP